MPANVKKIRLGVLPVLVVILLHPWAAQPAGGIDRVSSVESFEKSSKPGPIWRIRFRRGSGGRGYAGVSTLETPPTPRSSRYLSVNFRAPAGVGALIRPDKPLFIPGYVRSVRVWVFGFGRADELSIDLADRRGRRFRFSLGLLSFQGWRRLTFVPGARLTQRPPRMAGAKAGLYLHGFFLRPRAGTGRAPSRLYLDEVEAVVRPYQQLPKLRWRPN